MQIIYQAHRKPNILLKHHVFNMFWIFHVCHVCLQNILDVIITSLISGADAVEAQCKRFEVRASDGGKVLFSADEDEIVIGADRLKVTGMAIIKFLN